MPAALDILSILLILANLRLLGSSRLSACINAVTVQALNSSFYEQDGLRGRQQVMELLMNPADASLRGLIDGDRVVACNNEGEVEFNLKVTDRVPAGTVVTEGVWWSEFIGGRRGVNALTSQRLTDGGRGSTLYDVAVEVRKSDRMS